MNHTGHVHCAPVAGSHRPVMTPRQKNAFMALALAQASKALPNCWPNPPVGCVLVRAGKVLAYGHTQPPGNDHAEAMALRQLPGSLQHVHVFVTLEPCSFAGRTPSCAQTLVRRGARYVYVAVIDPHPRNRGSGIAVLRQANINVELGVLEAQVSRMLAPFLIRD